MEKAQKVSKHVRHAGAVLIKNIGVLNEVNVLHEYVAREIFYEIDKRFSDFIKKWNGKKINGNRLESEIGITHTGWLPKHGESMILLLLILRMTALCIMEFFIIL